MINELEAEVIQVKTKKKALTILFDPFFLVSSKDGDKKCFDVFNLLEKHQLL